MKFIRLTHPTGSDIWVTPKRIAWMEESDWECNYCPNCGQRLKWFE